jgi:hypothetical protein
MDKSQDRENFLPDWDPDVRSAILQTIEGRVPAASRETYMNEWREFQFWRASLNPPFTGKTNGNEVRGYLAQRWTQNRWMQSAKRWSKLSILRTMSEIVDGNIIKGDSTDRETQAWLIALGKTQTTKNASTFSREDVKRYLSATAADPMSLPARLILLMGCKVKIHSGTPPLHENGIANNACFDAIFCGRACMHYIPVLQRGFLFKS